MERHAAAAGVLGRIGEQGAVGVDSIGQHNDSRPAWPRVNHRARPHAGAPAEWFRPWGPTIAIPRQYRTRLGAGWDARTGDGITRSL